MRRLVTKQTQDGVLRLWGDFQNGNTRAGAIHSADAVMGVVSLFGPVGAAISGVYFVSRLFLESAGKKRLKC